MKRIISILLVLVAILTLASCGGKKDSLEDQYYNAAQEYVEKDDTETALMVIEEGLSKLPDSAKLLELKEKLTAEETQPAPVVPDEESIVKDFKALRMLYRKWFERYEFEYDGSAATFDENYMMNAPVKDAAVKTKADLDNLFLKYCIPSLYKNYSERTLVNFMDVNGVLYCSMPESFGYATTADKDIKVEKITDTDYILTYIEEISDEGDVYSYNVSLTYSLDADGNWKFGSETRTEEVNQTEAVNANNNNNNSYAGPNGQQIVEDIVGDTLNGIDGLIKDIL